VNFPARLSLLAFTFLIGSMNHGYASLAAPAPMAVASQAMPTATKTNHGNPSHEDIRALARKGLLDSAYHLSRKALEADSGDVFALFMAAKLSPEGRASGEYFKRAIKVGGSGPEAEESYFRLGQYYYAAGKYYQAIPSFRDYLRLFPAGDWKEPALYWMGNACLSYAQAKPAYLDSASAYFGELYKEQKSDDYYFPLALEGQAKAKAAQGDRQGAWEAAKAALEKAPEEERGALLLLSAQIRQGTDREEEKKLIAQVITQFPQSPEARYLRKLNAGTADQARWKSGSGLPKPVPTLGNDSLPASGSVAGSPSGALPSRHEGGSEKVTVTPPAPGNANSAPAGSAGAASDKGFTLQLGAFSQSPNARAMVANLTKLGFKPELVENDRNGKRLYQVRLGRFATPEEASEFARKNLKPHQLLSQPVPVLP